MNFWTPTWTGGNQWGEGLTYEGDPFFALFEFVKVESYNVETKTFKHQWIDHFHFFDHRNWEVLDEISTDQNSSKFKQSQSYVSNGALVFKLELQDHLAHLLDWE